VDDCELDALETRDAVDDLVDGSVPADGDEQARASRRSLAGEVDEVPGPLGDEGIAAQAASGREPRDLGPAPSGCAVVGRRVDEEGGFANESPT
jgi:hypothetical protein